MRRIWLVTTVCLPLVTSVSANEMTPPIGKLDPTAPSLPAQPREIDKLGFAAASLAWARATHPIDKYEPDKHHQLSPVEWQLVEALRALDTVPDSPSDQLAKAQADKRANIVKDVIEQGLKKGSVEAAKKELEKNVVEPTVLGDGQGPTRDALRGWIASSLFSYASKGAPETKDPVEILKEETKDSIGPAPKPDTKDYDKLFDQAEAVRRSLAQEALRVKQVNQQNLKQQAAVAKTLPTPAQLQQQHQQRMQKAASGSNNVITLPLWNFDSDERKLDMKALP